MGTETAAHNMLPTGFEDLDRVLGGGLCPSDLVILASGSGMGKTALAMNIACNLAVKEKVPVGIFSLGLSAGEMGLRLLCAETPIGGETLKAGHVRSTDWKPLYDAADVLSKCPLCIDDPPDLTAGEIGERIRRMKVEKGVRLVVVDCLQLMRPGSDVGDRMQGIAENTIALKGLARELDIPILALSQLGRDLESGTVKRPTIADLPGVRAVEENADVILFIYRDVMYKPADAEGRNKVEIILAKHGSGTIGTVHLTFFPESGRFMDVVP